MQNARAASSSLDHKLLKASVLHALSKTHYKLENTKLMAKKTWKK